MNQNIEVKARYPDLSRAREVCNRLDARFEAILHQTDTYFRATDGSRVKLRQIRTESCSRDACVASFVSSTQEGDAGVAATGAERVVSRHAGTDRAELIIYNRPNDASARTSSYTVEPLADVEETLTKFTQTLGLLVVVRKRRELYLWHNVRIHLDEVDGLGTFIEFEGVVDSTGGSDADAAVSRQRVDRLVKEFSIAPADQIGVSYSDLLLAMQKTERAGGE